MNSIHWTRKAVKQLLRLHSYHQQQVRDAVFVLERMPDAVNVKALVNHPCGYRLRVGSYRVLFDWDGNIQVVSIQEVKKRDERTYCHTDHPQYGGQASVRGDPL
ncbi:mRNA-degrading endonuclease RelE of RelBE toxin-antitoxin system [Pseudomonas poae]|jgi:mRNA-degrading endonuclease RelE of RelBE toxin-antitoxin system|uniref:mRNA-degrading endonuclease RelE of RelBE toxin-antitoxin system n=1 Tax=Pseudomonas poae TaxID=200451 RepID=A0A7Z1GS88_9PSED|nr:type II toxin-antitoxin system RelE/ParE family toxin [Pseudomonas marginalis]PFG70108.1 mRNA-degrading endonuclease RelE of RelBE toxin-antitoxin system [Pseudomonas poae]TWR72411.1 type II toxin-antitoxin system RelE/ParE family toxin [Pseudomonas marginalis]HAA39091.1 type II toxin-antitoxin system RelE/ParE family toxin [Pseudomonas sp.]